MEEGREEKKLEHSGLSSCSPAPFPSPTSSQSRQVQRAQCRWGGGERLPSEGPVLISITKELPCPLENAFPASLSPSDLLPLSANGQGGGCFSVSWAPHSHRLQFALHSLHPRTRVLPSASVYSVRAEPRRLRGIWPYAAGQKGSVVQQDKRRAVQLPLG